MLPDDEDIINEMDSKKWLGGMGIDMGVFKVAHENVG